MNRIGVMHLIDTLDAGGSERVAVNLVNLLPRERYQTHLCTTRREGLLASLVSEDVGRLCLERKWRFDVKALQKLIRYVQKHKIGLLHAHSTSLFIAALASLFPPFPKVVWHAHFGRYALEDRPARLYRVVAHAIDGAITVNQPLAEWSQRRMKISEDRVWYIPNFVCKEEPDSVLPQLPSKAGKRIVCVANLRAEKDHPTLIRAMEIVSQQVPDAHLLLVGAYSDMSYLNRLQQEMARLGLERHISLLGQRQDVWAILSACDIGVLSSASEGLPLTLLEYGTAGLPVVSTDVGQCREVLDDGKAGLLVPTKTPEAMASALISLLASPTIRQEYGQRLQKHVETHYSPSAIISQVVRIYDQVLDQKTSL